MEIKNAKLDFKDYVIFEQKTELDIESHRYRFEKVENTLREALDYMLRF